MVLRDIVLDRLVDLKNLRSSSLNFNFGFLLTNGIKSSKVQPYINVAIVFWKRCTSNNLLEMDGDLRDVLGIKIIDLTVNDVEMAAAYCNPNLTNPKMFSLTRALFLI